MASENCMGIFISLTTHYTPSTDIGGVGWGQRVWLTDIGGVSLEPTDMDKVAFNLHGWGWVRFNPT